MTQKNAQKNAARSRQREHGGKYAAHHRIVGGGTQLGGEKSWICSVCAKPIETKAGYILIKDAETGGYPRRATSRELKLKPEAIARREANGDPLAGLGVDLNDLERIRYEIAFDALHRECDPRPESGEYWVAVDDAATLHAWVRWVHHLTEKNWMGVLDLRRMIEFWFSNRGEHLHG